MLQDAYALELCPVHHIRVTWQQLSNDPPTFGWQCPHCNGSVDPVLINVQPVELEFDQHGRAADHVPLEDPH